MNNAIGYVRISSKDQSNFSLSGQEDHIRQFCEREKFNLLEVFQDDGYSAKSFDRPSWKELEKFIQDFHNQINYLVVAKYDRFSRNAAEGLNMIEKLENKYKIIILSVFERIMIDSSSPYFFKMRGDLLLGAELELRIIKDRTKFGIHQSAATGHFPNKAPWGYRNGRGSDRKPALIMDADKAPVIRFIFESFLMGTSQKEIARQAKKMGFEINGNGGVIRVVTNPVYAGLVKVSKFKDEPEKIIQGLHEGMVPVNYYYDAMKLIKNESNPRIIYNPEVPLRGVLHCNCGRLLTAGKSRGRNKTYWYYKCQDHLEKNHSANEIHSKFDEILKLMNLPDSALSHLKESFEKQFKAELKNKNVKLAEINKRVESIRKQMEDLEEKFFTGKISDEVYGRWRAKFEPEYNKLLAEQANLKQDDEVYHNRYAAQLPRLGDIHYLYNLAEVQEKQELVKMWFNWCLMWGGHIYRTTYMMPIFAHNLWKMKELHLLNLVNSNVIPIKNLIRSEIGS